jgi:hypothetical protein
MKGIAKYSQECIDATGLKRWVGLELEFDQNNKSPEEALDDVEEKVSKAIAKRNGFDHQPPELEYLNLGRMGAWPVIKDIQVTQEDKETGVTAEMILAAPDAVELESYRWHIHNNPELKRAYMLRYDQLTGK